MNIYESGVNYDVFYVDPLDDAMIKPGWYYWLFDRNTRLLTDPVGPYETAEEATSEARKAVANLKDKS